MKSEIRKFLESKIPDYKFGEHWKVVFFDDENPNIKSEYNIDELMQEYAKQNTLTKDNVIEVLRNTIMLAPSALIVGDHIIEENSINKAATDICALFVP